MKVHERVVVSSGLVAVVTMLKMQRNATLIVVEGPSQTGRAQIADRIATLQDSAEARVLRVPLPDSHPAFSDGLARLQAATGAPSFFTPEEIATIRGALRRHQLAELVRPALSAGQTVIVEGYWWSAKVAASLRRDQRTYLEHAAKLDELNWRKLRPDKIFLVLPQADDSEIMSISGECLATFERIARQASESILVRSVFRDCHLDVLQAAFTTHSSTQTKSVEQLAFFIDAARPAAPPEEPVPAVPETVTAKYTGAAPRELPHASPVYDTYWRFAVRRQEIFMKRLRGERPPWTTDPILLQHKFTNVYRASDRVSQYLIGRVIYSGKCDVDDMIFRILLFKIFNKIETWELLEEQIGDISWKTYNFARYDRVLSAALARATRIYSAAYIMPSVMVFERDRKHQNHLKLLERMMRERFPQCVEKATTLRDLFLLLRSYPGIGDFLAYQFAIDINYSPAVDFDESSFVVPGPGARDGIKKCFPDAGGLSEAEIIERVTERQDYEFDRLGLRFERLGHRELKLIDCQNIFCEVDKYARLKHPEIKGLSGRTRIKQVYRANSQPMSYFYPEKWGINSAIAALGNGIEKPSSNNAIAALNNGAKKPSLPPPRATPPIEQQLGLLVIDDNSEVAVL